MSSNEKTLDEHSKIVYEKLKSHLDEMFKNGNGNIPNIPVIKRQIRLIKNSIKSMEKAAIFAPNLEAVEAIELRMSIQKGKLQAFEEKMKEFRKAMAEA